MKVFASAVLLVALGCAGVYLASDSITASWSDSDTLDDSTDELGDGLSADEKAAAAAAGSCPVHPPNLGDAFFNPAKNNLVDVDAYLKRMMNTDADPCEDFVQYACGGWINDSPPVDADVGSVNEMFSTVAYGNQYIQQFMFDNYAAETPYVGEVMSSCLDLSGQKKKGFKFGVDNFWPKLSGPFTSGKQFVEATVLNGFVGSILFDMEVGEEYNVQEQTYLQIDEDATTDDMNSWDESFVPLNAAYIAKYLPMLGVDASLAVDLAWIDYNITNVPISSYETKVYMANNLTQVADINWRSVLGKFGVDIDDPNFAVVTSDADTFNGAIQLYDDMVAAGKSDVLSAWAKWRVFAGIGSALAPSLRPTDPPSFHANKLHKAKPMPKHVRAKRVRRDAEARLAKELLELAHGKPHPSPMSALHSISRRYEDSAGRRVPNMSPFRMVRHMRRFFDEQRTSRFWSPTSYDPFCSQVVTSFMPDLVGKLYADISWTPETMDSLSDLVDRILATFRTNVANNEWMDEETKTRALDKVDNIVKKIGYPEPDAHLDELTVYADDWLASLWNIGVWRIKSAVADRLFKHRDRMTWATGFFGSPMLVNAFYSPDENSINLPAGLVQYKLFGANIPVEMNYGGYGAVVGHEITHGFDNNGRRYGPTGEMTDWWTASSSTEFDERAQCFIDYYDGIPVHGTEAFINGTVTLGENIADNGGVRTAYYAMQSYLQDHPDERTSSRELTSNQLFFVGWATSWCMVGNADYLAANVLSDEHAYGFARIIGPVANSHEFAEAFQCRDNAPMNPAQKCFLW